MRFLKYFQVTSFKCLIKDAVDRSDYKRCIALILKHSERGRRDFATVLKRCVRREINTYMSTPTTTSADITMANITSFTWMRTMTEVKDMLPTLHTCLVGALTNRLSEADVDM
jgi:hypothetical protein